MDWQDITFTLLQTFTVIALGWLNSILFLLRKDLNRHEERITALEKGKAVTDEKVRGLWSRMKREFDLIRDEIKTIKSIKT